VNPEGLRVDFVDRNVDVLVIRVVVAHRDVLVLGKPQSIRKSIHDVLELLSLEAPIVGVKGDHEVVGALAARAGVLRLNRLNESAR